MSRFAPNRVQSPIKNTVLLPFSFAPAGTGAPTLVAGKGSVSSVARTSTGLFTATFSPLVSTGFNPSTAKGPGKFKALIEAQVTLQLTSAPALTAATYLWTDATDSDTVTFSAGPAAAGAAGNNVAVVVSVGAALATAVTYAAGLTTVTITTAATTTPTQLATYVNTTAPNGLVTISAHTGTTAFSVGLTTQTLTGGASTATLFPQIGAVVIPGASDAAAETMQIRLIDSTTGAVADLASGGVINVELLLEQQSSGPWLATGAA